MTSQQDQEYTLMGPDGAYYTSSEPGRWGGNLSTGVYGRLDCRAARQALQRGGYADNRVFFATERDARQAGFRPCGVCCPKRYQAWKQKRPTRRSGGAGQKR